jgi:hypothetical protein
MEPKPSPALSALAPEAVQLQSNANVTMDGDCMGTTVVFTGQTTDDRCQQETKKHMFGHHDVVVTTHFCHWHIRQTFAQPPPPLPLSSCDDVHSAAGGGPSYDGLWHQDRQSSSEPESSSLSLSVSVSRCGGGDMIAVVVMVISGGGGASGGGAEVSVVAARRPSKGRRSGGGVP